MRKFTNKLCLVLATTSFVMGCGELGAGSEEIMPAASNTGSASSSALFHKGFGPAIDFSQIPVCHALSGEPIENLSLESFCPNLRRLMRRFTETAPDGVRPDSQLISLIEKKAISTEESLYEITTLMRPATLTQATVDSTAWQVVKTALELTDIAPKVRNDRAFQEQIRGQFQAFADEMRIAPLPDPDACDRLQRDLRVASSFYLLFILQYFDELAEYPVNITNRLINAWRNKHRMSSINLCMSIRSITVVNLDIGPTMINYIHTTPNMPGNLGYPLEHACKSLGGMSPPVPIPICGPNFKGGYDPEDAERVEKCHYEDGYQIMKTLLPKWIHWDRCPETIAEEDPDMCPREGFPSKERILGRLKQRLDEYRIDLKRLYIERDELRAIKEQEVMKWHKRLCNNT